MILIYQQQYIDLPTTITAEDGKTAYSVLSRFNAILPTEKSIVGKSVDATSGSFLLINTKCTSITPGIMYDDLRGFDCSEEVDEDMANAMIDCPVAILKWHDDFAKCDTLAKYFHNMQALESTARFLCYIW